MPFAPDRLRGLLRAKALQHDELGDEVPANQLRKWVNGHGAPGAENLEKLAHALDATMEFLHGDDEYDFGNTDEGYAKSAAHMSFRIFLRDRAFNEQQQERCLRVRDHRGAPRTAAAWRDFAEMVELAIGPKPPQIGLVKKGQ